MSKRSLILPVAAVAIALGGCATSGHGYGETRRGGAVRGAAGPTGDLNRVSPL